MIKTLSVVGKNILLASVIYTGNDVYSRPTYMSIYYSFGIQNTQEINYMNVHIRKHQCEDIYK